MPISRLVHRLAALLVALSVTTGRAGDDLAELRARLDAVEQQNAMLLERLDRAEAVNERQAGIVPAGASLNEPPCLNPMDCAPGVGAGAHAAAGGSAADPLTMTVIWNHGLEAHTRDKRFRVHIGGRTQVDAIWLENDTAAFVGAGGAGDDDAVAIRRARVKVDGTMYGFIDWAFQCDFVNSDNINRPAASSEANVSNVPAQALTLWNDPFVLQQCERTAALLADEPPAALAAALYWRLYGRAGTAGELAAAAAFVADQCRLGASPAEAATDLVHTMVNGKEFLFLR